MKLLTILSFVLLTSCILRPPPPADKKFMALHHEQRLRLHGALINKVHAPHLVINYGYGDDCPPEARNNDERLTGAVSKALRTWLQPLRDYTDKQIVKDFRYRLVADPRPAAGDMWIIFHCGLGASTALVGGATPGINLRSGTKAVIQLMNSLMHEMGHVFGLDDTYITTKERGKPGVSKGGLKHTRGTQPNSVMALSGDIRGHEDPIALDGLAVLFKDDINGIIWLYRHVHEGLPLEDCAFPEYELEEDPMGCRPKYPLIFEIKYGRSDFWAGEVLNDDRDIDINAQDKDGLTALHHAVLKGYKELVIELSKHQGIDINAQDKDGLTALHHAVLKRFDDVVARLIAHQDIKPFLKNADGHRALDLARQLELPRIVTLIAAHPKAMPVAAKGKQTTTWGELKKE